MRNPKGITLLFGFFLCLQVTCLCQAPKAFDARKAVQKLTHQKFHGRGYVDQGCNRAGKYLQRAFREIGIEPIGRDYRQPFLLDVNTFPGSCSVKLGGHTLQPGKDFLIHPKSGGIRKAALSLKWLTASEVLSLVVLPLTDRYPNESIAFKTFEVKDKDSIKKIQRKLEQIAQEMQPVIEFTKDKLTWSVADECFGFPYVQMAIDPKVAQGQKLYLDIKQQMQMSYEVNNLVGVIPSQEKSDTYLAITAHYDHLGEMGKDTFFPGANDNASGVAMLLTLGKHFKNSPLKNHNVLLIAFAGEEAGLLGSQYFTRNPKVPLANISFLVNVDIMGSGEEGITVVNGSLHKEAFDRLTHINDSLALLPQIKIRGKAANSDHYPFSEKGVPAFFLHHGAEQTLP